MSYSLISTDYILDEYGVKDDRIPRGAIRCGNGSFVVKSPDDMPANFELYFEVKNGKINPLKYIRL